MGNYQYQEKLPLSLGDGLDPFHLTSIKDSPLQKSEEERIDGGPPGGIALGNIECRLVESEAEFRKQARIDVAVSASALAYSGEASFHSGFEKKLRSSSMALMLSLNLDYGWYQMKEKRLKEGIVNLDPNEFIGRFGREYVHRVRRGAFLSVFYYVDWSETEDTKDLAIQVKARCGGFSGQALFNTFMTESSKLGTLNFRVWAEGASLKVKDELSQLVNVNLRDYHAVTKHVSLAMQGFNSDTASCIRQFDTASV